MLKFLIDYYYENLNTLEKYAGSELVDAIDNACGQQEKNKHLTYSPYAQDGL